MKMLCSLALIIGTLSYPVIAMEREVSKKSAESDPAEALKHAIGEGTVQELKKLLEKGVNPNMALKTYFNPVKPIIYAAGLGTIEKTYEYMGPVLSKDEALAKIRTLLEHGAIIENLPQESELFFKHANAEARGDFNGQEEHISQGIKKLLEQAQSRLKYPNINKKDEHGKAPLHYAAGQNNVVKVQELIKAGADVTIRDGHQNTPLHEAAYFGAVAVIEPLVKAGADLNAQEQYGDTPLHKAVYNKQKGAVEKLIQLGASLTSKNKKGQTPKDMAQDESIKKSIQEAQEGECAICLDKFSKDDPATLTKCLHKFHGRCINDARIQKCPLCRKVIK
jgi:ankyrin repeat protein